MSHSGRPSDGKGQRSVDAEVDRQVDTLVRLGYPGLTGHDEPAFRRQFDPLRAVLADVEGDLEATPRAVPFVLVIGRTLLPSSPRVPLVTLDGRPGTVNRHFADADDFAPIETIAIPDAPVYALIDVDRGDEFLDVRPADAVAEIQHRGRTPLTIEEGLCLLHASPASLERNRCFHLAGSRGGDKRVPAVWIADRAPTLGWCWLNNKHSWLGTASVQQRLAA